MKKKRLLIAPAVFKLKKLKSESAEEYSVRKLGLRKYHYKRDGEDDALFETMESLLPRIHSEFIKSDTTLTVNNLSLSEVDDLTMVPINDDEEAAVKKLADKIKKKTTMIRLCDHQCPLSNGKVFLAAENHIMKMKSFTDAYTFAQHLVSSNSENMENTDMHFSKFLTMYHGCYSGIRSIETKYKSCLNISTELIKVGVKVCIGCRQSIYKDKVPDDSVLNFMTIEQAPECLQNLNWIEKSMIQLLRPVQSVVHLIDNGGRKTDIKGAGGVMVLLPVPIEETVSHLANTLPSCKHLKIVVDAGFTMRIVSVSKMVTALKWLKENNEKYKHVIINEAFEFTENDQILFKKPDTQDKFRKLIAIDETENEAMIQNDDCVIQNLRENEYHGDNLQALQRYTLKKIKYTPQPLSSLNDVETLVFPALFPTGRFGSCHPRTIKIKKSTWLRQRLLNWDRRIAQDSDFLCFQFGLKCQLEMTSAMGTNAQISKNSSGSDVLDGINKGGVGFETKLQTMFKQVRGFPSYWLSVKKELNSHVISFGPPQLYYTVNGEMKSFCRFEFPRPITPTTIVYNKDQNRHKLPGVKSKEYSLARKPEETMINDYNGPLLLAWGGNIDIQGILGGDSTVLAYVTGYATKSETSKISKSTLFHDSDNIKEKITEWNMALEMMHQRQAGTPEICDILLGHHLYGFDTGHVFLNTNQSEKRHRKLKPVAKLEEGERATESNAVDDYYPQRSEKLEDVSFFNFSIQFEVVRKTNNTRAKCDFQEKVRLMA
ncbi:hypothetical protein B9Z55_028857 [Caenorhabditis nigoni]|uniref:DUF6570 domain-containing protein n=1 Tax=Caenorhabditis nigoni TaxID=1611254 RepID=A0A2G5S9S4_9PELO|nr:hypothetical protein B9Z55_028857 [Caenorhabditis nigoni]